MDELKKLLEAQAKAFEEFKALNDKRIAEIEKGKGAGELTAQVEKANAEIARLSAEIKALETKANRPDKALSPKDSAAKEHAEAFGKFLRKGHDANLRDLEQKAALRTGDDTDGGYTVPEVTDTQILELERNISPMRSLATVISLTTAEYKKLVNLQGTGSGWVGEEEDRAETTAPSLAALTPYMGELYAKPYATQQMLDDSFLNVEQWLANEVAMEFAEEEASAFVTGTGVKKPKGFAAYTAVSTADASRTFGQLQYVASGTSGVIVPDTLISTVHALKAGYRPGSVWASATATFAAIRKLKTGEGNYLWQPGLASGQPATLLGYPCVEMEDMAAISASSLSIAFGNFKRGYTIVDRMGTRVLRDPYTAKPYVQFYTTKRVGGMLTDSNAIKLYKLSAS